jgi:methanogen homocitrate synthase
MTESKFYPGEYNDFVRQSMKLPAKVLINDVTLREGEQAADVDFSMENKIEIVKKLAELGVQQVQCGYPGRSKIDWETIKTIKAEKIPIQTEAIAQVFQKDWKEQIDICISCQPDSLDLMYPSSPLRLKYVQKASEEEMNGQLLHLEVNVLCSTPAACSRSSIGSKDGCTYSRPLRTFRSA